MELFRPDISGDLLFFDLDTVIVGDIRHFADICRTTMLTDFYQEAHPASGLMYLTEEDRAPVWEEWIRSPDQWMRQYRNGGDQHFMRGVQVIRCAQRWQKIFPKQIISYKCHIRTTRGDRDLPPEARVVCFHGKPRPWSISAPWTRGIYHEC
jgi:hypothetical protein